MVAAEGAMEMIVVEGAMAMAAAEGVIEMGATEGLVPLLQGGGEASTPEPVEGPISKLPFETKVVLTVLIVAALLGIRYAAGRWQSSHHPGERSALKLTVSGCVAVITTLGVLSLIDIWDLLVPLQRAVVNLGGDNLPGKVLISGVLLAATYALTSFIGRVIEELTGPNQALSEHEREIVFRLAQVGLYAVVLLVVLSLFTQDIGSFLVGAGFLGVVLGLAAQQTLGSIVAGFVLMFSRPFELGDWVIVVDESEDGVEGIVTDITIFNTRIQTFDGEYVMLPNDEISASSIVNRTRKGRLRIEVDVGVDYDADPERAADVALSAVDDLEETMSVPSPQVVLKEFGDSAVLLGVRVWVDNPSARRVWRARSAVVAAIKRAYDEEGIKIPYPQHELTARREEGGFRLAGGRDRGVEATPDGGDRDGENRDGGGR
ncbi:mechanosensitive ion channel family protein [Halegenticoccus soli]|uniref:mechanosensitive ion channel family protein n=1 Tax=Halegenticoccus soli TaxID=1985678 RepID=UPI0013043DA7|nr:mechanosensitive ion channel family protein [Halegenticoccus soli]